MNDSNTSDDPVEQMLRRKPLIAFSVYTDIQATILIDTANNIRAGLDDIFEGDVIQVVKLNSAYGLFWLWLLGAYEVVRTMCQAENCFSQGLRERLESFKRRLADLRIPFAKQEYRGERVPIRGELSMTRHPSRSEPDLVYRLGEDEYSARSLLYEFDTIFGEIGLDDILSEHRKSVCFRIPK